MSSIITFTYCSKWNHLLWITLAFMPVSVDTAGRIYEDFSRLLFLHAHREASPLANELPEESEQFRFLRAACFANIKGSVGLILAKASAMRISIPLDLSSRPFIPLPRFMRARRVTQLLAPSLVFFSWVICLSGTCGDFFIETISAFLDFT
jgi:hypothetical protein